MPHRGWPRGRIGWLIGTVVLLGSGVLFGLIMQNVLLDRLAHRVRIVARTHA